MCRRVASAASPCCTCARCLNATPITLFMRERACIRTGSAAFFILRFGRNIFLLLRCSGNVHRYFPKTARVMCSCCFVADIACFSLS